MLTVQNIMWSTACAVSRGFVLSEAAAEQWNWGTYLCSLLFWVYVASFVFYHAIELASMEPKFKDPDYALLSLGNLWCSGKLVTWPLFLFKLTLQCYWKCMHVTWLKLPIIQMHESMQRYVQTSQAAKLHEMAKHSSAAAGLRHISEHLHD